MQIIDATTLTDAPETIREAFAMRLLFFAVGMPESDIAVYVGEESGHGPRGVRVEVEQDGYTFGLGFEDHEMQSNDAFRVAWTEFLARSKDAAPEAKLAAVLHTNAVGMAADIIDRMVESGFRLASTPWAP